MKAARHFLPPVLLAVLLLVAPAWGTTLRPKEVTCPVCEKDIVVVVVNSSNTFGGPDFDLCSHSRGGDPRSYAVWTCPVCLYSRHAGEFLGAPAEEIATRIRKELAASAPIAPDASQSDIPGSEKYRLAGEILGWEGADADVIAFHWLDAAWTTRSENDGALVEYHRDPDLAAIRERLDEEYQEYWLEPRPGRKDSFSECRAELAWADRLLERSHAEGVAAPERSAFRLEAAAWRCRRGENLPAVEILEPLAADEAAPGSIRQSAKQLLRQIGIESEFQDRFLESFPAARTAATWDDADLAANLYIAGETCRRLGRPEEAAKWFLRSLEVPDGPAWAYVVARDGFERLGIPGPPAEELEAIRAARIARVIARLNDPETAGDADDELRFLQDRSAIPGIVAALASEHPEVRAAAALTLRFQPEPGEEAVRGLCGLLGDPDQEPRFRAAMALSEIGAPESRRAIEDALVAVDDEDSLRYLIEALGIVGEAESVEVLLTAYYVMDREVEAALSLLANLEFPKDFNTREEVLDWWKERRPGPRRDWVKRGFEEEGVAIEKPWARESVPELLDLLNHERPWIRANAVRCLREISGRLLPWEDIASDFDWPSAIAERNAAIAEWRGWWEKNG